MSSLDVDLFPIFVKQGRSHTRYKVGYINRHGDIVIDAEFDYGGRFTDGLAVVRVRQKWGVIDKEGTVVVRPKFLGASRFQEGLAPACLQSLQWGFIDSSGEFRIPPQFACVGEFSEGVAWVRNRSDKHGFVDSSGALITAMIYDLAHEHSEGLAAVKLGDLWGYIDLTGSMAISPRFSGRVAGAFSEKLARVLIGDSFAFIDASGKVLIEPRFPFALEFSEGMALVGNSFEKMAGYIDHQGNLAIRLRNCGHAGSFSEGLAVAKQGSTKMGFMNHEGEFVIPPRFLLAEPFYRGLAFVVTEDSVGYIDKTGEYVWQGPYVETGILWP